MTGIIALILLPYGFLELCAADPSRSCAVDKVTLEDVAAINTQVNLSIDPVIGANPWRPFPQDRRGDCTTYAATKRAALIGLGLPPRDVRFAGGVTESGESHLVLEVTIDGKAWILDNRVPETIYAPGKAPYPLTLTEYQSFNRAVWMDTDADAPSP